MNFAWLMLGLHLCFAVTSVGHVLLNKRDPPSALGWIAVCIAYPLVGPLFYYLFGINRIRTRARILKGERPDPETVGPVTPVLADGAAAGAGSPAAAIDNTVVSLLARSSDNVTHRPLVEGNTVAAFYDGDSAYAAMREAIAGAKHSVCLASYIFDTDRSGREFIDALIAAHRRGVDVRVILDGVGEWYSIPRAGSLLHKQGLKIARFVPPSLWPPAVHINLRNHRKLLIVDDRYGYSGGMNIGDRHLQTLPNGRPGTTDLHFQLTGPIVSQMQQVFDEDWAFATGETSVPRPASPAQGGGTAVCRTVTDGPNEDIGKLSMIIMSAVALARKRIAIMTPYFLPPPGLVSALQAAALRGVEVIVILPRESNQPLVQWATRNVLRELLQYGVHICYRPPPFAHSKLFLVDDNYAIIGSANLDPRSLRLNFELVIEVFDAAFVATMGEHFQQVKDITTEETISGVDGRSLPTRLRDAAAWLFSPYL